LFFHFLYNPFAWTYDWVAAFVSLGHWQEWVLGVLPYVSGARVLELGHGPGHLQVALHERGFHVVGLDLSSTMGKIARRRLRGEYHLPPLVRGNAQHLPFPAGAFDQVVSTFPSEYLFQLDTLSEVYRVLAPSGHLVVLPVAWIRRGSRVERSLAWLFRTTHQAPPQDDDQWRLRLITLFQKSGFEVRTETIAMPSSEIFLLLASKPKVL
jgi:ubiquinone/menaquinone biosynthesis C-methylase UbiE